MDSLAIGANVGTRIVSTEIFQGATSVWDGLRSYCLLLGMRLPPKIDPTLYTGQWSSHWNLAESPMRSKSPKRHGEGEGEGVGVGVGVKDVVGVGVGDEDATGEGEGLVGPQT